VRGYFFWREGVRGSVGEHTGYTCCERLSPAGWRGEEGEGKKLLFDEPVNCLLVTKDFKKKEEGY
jgi:hypothetical protein